MSRPVAIQDAVILEAARQVFLAQGYGAGTALIARKAGVSVGSLFKHFKTKDDLFRAAMDVSGYAQAWETRLMSAAGTGDVRCTLEAAGHDLLTRLQTMIPRVVMVNASGVTIPGCRSARHPPPPIRLIAILARYLQAETRHGRLRVKAPASLAHVFVGALSHYVFCDCFFRYRSAPPRAYVRSLVGALLGAAGGNRPAKRPRRPVHS